MCASARWTRGRQQCFTTRMSHQKVGMSKVAYHRMLVGVGGLDVVKRAKRWNMIGPSQKRQPFKGARKKCNEIVLSMCTAQCGSMEAKALSFVLHAASPVVNQARVYVCSGRAGGNERHGFFYARYEETWPHPPPHPNPMCYVASNMRASFTMMSVHPTPPPWVVLFHGNPLSPRGSTKQQVDFLLGFKFLSAW